jgi:adenine-specific DNA-methyltransferase
MDTIANTPGIEEGMSAKEIQNLVSKNADSVLLFDRPLVDPKGVRVSGPFTVESLSPHRQLVDELGESHDAMAESGIEAAKFADDVRDQLRRAGVRYPRKGTPIRFETLDAQPGGTLIHAVGTPVELGNVQRVAVSIGPRFGTVTRQMVLDASKEAAGLGADMLVVCGFAYEADAQEIPNIGRLEVVCARMNSDLLVEGLKATKSGELFTVFGEPDIDIRRAGDLLEVEIRGIDVFDPTSGEIRADATTDISAWFIDTDYNSEAFFVRHAYFLGDEQPYERLQKALKGEISPESWDSLYSATSRKFPVPKTGKIAIKVINHFGDEVMKVYPIA